jgi:hypothetical protein
MKKLARPPKIMRKARRKKRLSPFEAKIEFQRSQNFLQELGKQTEREVIAKDLKNRRVLLNEQRNYFYE